MPVIFGSIGDIIPVSLLIKDLISALDSSRGSSANYQAVVQELQVLDCVLCHAEELARSNESTTELQALYSNSQQTVKKCRACIIQVTEKIRKYSPSLAGTGSGNVFKDTGRKAQWHILGKEEVERFRAEITVYTNSISVLIATITVTLLRASSNKTRSQIKSLELETNRLMDRKFDIHAVLERDVSNGHTHTISRALAKRFAI